MTLETLGDASIVHERRLGIWTIAAAGARLTIIASESRSFEMSSLVSPSGQSWIVASTAGTTIDADGRSLAFGSRSDGFRLEEPSTSNDGHTLRLDLPYLVSAADFRATRHFVVTSGSPTFETWTTFESIGRAITLADLNAFQFAVPAGTIHALNGLQGDAADVTRDTAFTLRTLNPAAGTSVALGAQGRSSEQSVPWLAVDGAQDEFYAALMWSGSWSAHIDRSNAGLSLSFGLAPMTTTIQRSRWTGLTAFLASRPAGCLKPPPRCAPMC